eukprot:11144466-Lingulodinium_polyedra.AAC.1
MNKTVSLSTSLWSGRTLPFRRVHWPLPRTNGAPGPSTSHSGSERLSEKRNSHARAPDPAESMPK